MFFMTFCDNNLNVIATLRKSTQQEIEKLEQHMNTIKSYEDFVRVKEELSAVITTVCETHRTDATLLYFVGGLTMIEQNMKWCNGRVRYSDIDDKNKLR